MLDIQAEAFAAGPQHQDLYESVVELKRRHDLHPCAVRPRDGMSLRDESEREIVQELVGRFRRLPEETRIKLPALWNSLAQLEVVVGDLATSLEDFQEIARHVSDPISRAEAHHNVHLTALERRDWNTALIALKRAVALDPDTFEPFPLLRYEPLQILGAGGLGVSYLCRESKTRREVVLKTLRADSLDRSASSLFRDFETMRELDHPALIDVLEMGFAGSEEMRPYLVLERIEGKTLKDHVQTHGPLDPDDWFEIAWQLLRALQALHNRMILHRALRPEAILLHREKNKDGATIWQVKLMDTGLALKRSALHASASNPDALRITSLGRSVAQMLPYAPPEVVSRPKGLVWVGLHSDLYNFGKICAFALTGRPDPDNAACMLLPSVWQKVIADCTQWVLKRRPAHAGTVLDALTQHAAHGERISPIERNLYEATIESLSQQLVQNADDVEAYLKRAAALYRQGDYDAAVIDYTEAIRLRPEDAATYRRRAQSLARANRLAEAVADYTEALRLAPGHLETIANRGLTYSQMEEHDKAIADYSEGLRLNSRDEILYYNRGNSYFFKGNYAHAIADYTEALRLEPRNLWTIGNRGKAYLISGQARQAVADFTRLLDLDPGNVKALSDRASAQQELGRHDRAIADYTEALQLEPSASLYHNRGLTRATAGDLVGAVGDFTEALTLSNDDVSILLSRAKANADLAKFDDALADLTAALSLAPDFVHLYSERADVYLRMERWDDALADLNAALELQPGASILFQRGVVESRRGELERAIADFTEVIRQHPHATGAYTNRGNAHLVRNELDLALADFNQAIELSPKDAMTRYCRANTQVRMGNLEAALADYSSCLELDPAYVPAYLARSQLHAEQENWTDAIADLGVAIRLQPANPRLLTQRGNLYAERGARDKALADFSEAIRLDSEYVSAWYNRGILHLDAGKFEDAIVDFSETLRLESDSLGALVNRGLALRKTGQLDRAMVDFSAAIDLAPTFEVAYYNRAHLRVELGDLPGAIADLSVVLEQSPDDLESRVRRARLFDALGKYDEALADNLAALELAPDNARVMNNLAWLLATVPREELRDPERAVELAERTVQELEEATNLDTLAAALAAHGRFEEAIATQRRALELASEGEQPDFRARLELYEQGRAFVQPLPKTHEPDAESSS